MSKQENVTVTHKEHVMQQRLAHHQNSMQHLKVIAPITPYTNF